MDLYILNFQKNLRNGFEVRVITYITFINTHNNFRSKPMVNEFLEMFEWFMKKQDVFWLPS